MRGGNSGFRIEWSSGVRRRGSGLHRGVCRKREEGVRYTHPY